MSLLTVIKYPAPSLKKPSVEVREFNSWLQDIVKNMFETMYAEHGIGLAAPQVGENIRLFVMDIQKPDPFQEGQVIHNKICMVNPRLTKAEGLINYEEGCLSCPDLIVEVERAKDIVVESLTPDGKAQRHVLTELEAVCAQHEMDHLKGILLVDKISRLKREMYGKERVRARRDDSDKPILA